MNSAQLASKTVYVHMDGHRCQTQQISIYSNVSAVIQVKLKCLSTIDLLLCPLAEVQNNQYPIGVEVWLFRCLICVFADAVSNVKAGNTLARQLSLQKFPVAATMPEAVFLSCGHCTISVCGCVLY